MKKQLSLTRRFFPLLCASGLALSCGGIDPNANDNMGGDNPPKVNPFEAKPEGGANHAEGTRAVLGFGDIGHIRASCRDVAA